MSPATTGTCYNGECEGLHLPVEEIVEQATWPKPSHPKVIVTAGRFVDGSATLQQWKRKKPFFVSQVHRQPMVYSRAHVHLKRPLDHQC